MAVSLWFSVRSLIIFIGMVVEGYFVFILEDAYRIPQILVYPIYEIMQIIAVILYLRSKVLGYVLGVNILGLIIQMPSLPRFINNLLRLDVFLEYAKFSMYLDWALYIIDVILCVFFVVVIIREYSRRQKLKMAQEQPGYAAAPHASVPQTVLPQNPEVSGQVPTTSQSQHAQSQNPPEQPLT